MTGVRYRFFNISHRSDKNGNAVRIMRCSDYDGSHKYTGRKLRELRAERGVGPKRLLKAT